MDLAIEIVVFPMKILVIFHSYVNVDQRVPTLLSPTIPATKMVAELRESQLRDELVADDNLWFGWLVCFPGPKKIKKKPGEKAKNS